MDGGQFPSVARIGPNAILQLVPVLDRAWGDQARIALFKRADVDLPAPNAGMLPETQVVRLHRALCLWHPDEAPALLRAAGLATGDYILANRIPRPAQILIRLLPARLAARVLARAIAKHAWTFAGSGRFSIESHHPLIVRIADNPLATGHGEHPDCHWHSAVFERLFGALVWPQVQVTEIECSAAGAAACSFTIGPKL